MFVADYAIGVDLNFQPTSVYQWAKISEKNGGQGRPALGQTSTQLGLRQSAAIAPNWHFDIGKTQTGAGTTTAEVVHGEAKTIPSPGAVALDAEQASELLDETVDAADGILTTDLHFSTDETAVGFLDESSEKLRQYTEARAEFLVRKYSGEKLSLESETRLRLLSEKINVLMPRVTESHIQFAEDLFESLRVMTTELEGARTRLGYL